MFSKEIIEQIRQAKALRDAAKAENAEVATVKVAEDEIDENYDAIRMAGSEYTTAPVRGLTQASW